MRSLAERLAIHAKARRLLREGHWVTVDGNHIFIDGNGDGGSGGSEGSGGSGTLTETDKTALDKWVSSEEASSKMQKLRSDPKMIAIFEKLPKHQGTVFRGTHIHTKGSTHGSDISKLKVGKTFSVSKLSSATTDFDRAKGFAQQISETTFEQVKGVVPVIFKIEQSSGRAIPHEETGGEAEVVLMPKTKFKVTSIREVHDDEFDMTYREISMAQV